MNPGKSAMKRKHLSCVSVVLIRVDRAEAVVHSDSTFVLLIYISMKYGKSKPVCIFGSKILLKLASMAGGGAV